MMAQVKGKLQRALSALEKGRLKQAEMLFLECLDKIEDKSTADYQQALHGMGIVKFELNDDSDARDIYVELLRIAVAATNKQEEALAYHQLGMIEQRRHDYDEALTFFIQAQEIYQALAHPPALELAVNLYEQGMTHVGKGSLTQADVILKKALHYAKQTSDHMIIGHVNKELGQLASTFAQLPAANQFFQQASYAFQQSGYLEKVKDIEEKRANL